MSVRWGDAGIDLAVPDVNFGFQFSDGQTTLPTTALAVSSNNSNGYPRFDTASGVQSLENYRLGAGVDDFQFADGTMVSLEQLLQLTIAPVNHAPTDIALSSDTVAENAPNATIGSLSTTDADAGDTFTYSIIPGGDGAQFAIAGNELRVGTVGLDFEAGATRAMTIRTTDAAGAHFDRSFSINVTDVAEGNTAPVVSAGDATVILGQTVAASSLFSVADAENDGITQYEFWDSTSGNGHFEVNGVEAAVNVTIPVSAADLAGTVFTASASIGNDLVWVRANDGQAWSDWKSWYVQSSPHLTNALPVVTAASSELLVGDSVAASTLFTATDADGDPITQYEFWDDIEGGGYFRVNGTQQGAAHSIGVSAADLANTDYVAGAGPGTEQVWVRASDGIGWGAWKSWNITSALHIPNAAPEVAAQASQTALLNQSVAASGLFSVTDADNDPITKYEFWDSTSGNGHFSVNGIEQGVNVSIAVSAAQLAGTQFIGAAASGSDLVWVRASDGQTWSDWKSWNVNSWPHLTNAAPVASASDATVLVNQAVSVASLFSVTDADGDAMAKYEFWDDVNGGGYFRVNGVQQGAAQSIAVSAADLAATEYVGGSSPGAGQVWVRANDGLEWSAWKAWNMTTALHIPNAAPVVSASDSTVLLNNAVAASGLFSVTDADNDAITRYEFWDSTAGNGHFEVNGVAAGVNVSIPVNSSQIQNTVFVGAPVSGTDQVWVRANDGQVWSDWKSWNVASAPHLTNAAPVVTASNATLLLNEAASAASLFSVTDADNDAITQYEFWDDVAGGGYFRVNGAAQAAAQSIGVSAADLANTEYVGGANPGAEQVWVRANDGLAWSAWRAWNMTTALHVPNAAPVVTAADSTILLNSTADASSLFSVSDADNDAITRYEFWDSTAGVGHFTVNGAAQGVNVSIPVLAADLQNTRFIGASASGADQVWGRANDGQTWSDWKSWTMQSAPHLTNAAPVVSAQTQGLLRNESVSAASLFSVTDADNDAITQYEFWDDVNGGGHFELNGVQQAAAASIAVTAADLANTTYMGGANAGTEQVWVRANDGIAWGAWKNWNMSTEGGMVRGGAGPDTLNGDASTPLLQGGAGDDTLSAGPPNSLLDGGTGNDTLNGGAGNDLLAGGAGNDTIATGGGHNVIAHNAGGGADTISSDAGASNTVSLGGGARYEDLSLSKDGNDLVLGAGGSDSLRLKDWYSGKDTVESLQLILDATNAYDANSADPLYNKRVQTFDFRGMVNQFDQALAQSPGLTSWALTNALLRFHLSGSDDAALGGDLAYWYGKNNGFGGIGLAAAQQVIGAAGFGAEAQQLHAFGGLQEGLVKLA